MNYHMYSYGITFKIVSFLYSGIREAQMVYSLSSIYAFQLIFAKTFKEGCEILTQALIPVLILLGSPENATLFVFLHILEDCVKNLASCHDKLTSTLVLLHIGQSMYFLQVSIL